MITKYIVGDITETELDFIAHGVNCQNVMGSGVAKALFTKWIGVKLSYHDFCDNKKPEELLGKVDIFTQDKTIFNCFTQVTYGYDGTKRVNYSAVVDCFKEIMQVYNPKQLAIPKIGCGLAGGNWTFMEQLINDTVSDRIEIWVYDNNPARSSGKNDAG